MQWLRRFLETRYKPDMACINFFWIDWGAFASEKGIYLILDLDNTLLEKGANEADIAIRDDLAAFRRLEVIRDICIVSNIVKKNGKREVRVFKIAKELGIRHVVCACGLKTKPHKAPLNKAMKMMGAKPENTVVVGDQLFTDILGGKRVKAKTILVRPLGPDAWFTQPKRWLEKVVFRLMNIDWIGSDCCP